MTFLEAYALHGRNSAAIAEVCGIDGSEAYNLMAAQMEADRRAGIKRAWYAKIRWVLVELRREARG